MGYERHDGAALTAMARPKLKRTVAVVIAVVCMVVALRIWYVRSHGTKTGEWFGEMSRHLDERARSNGLVEVHPGTWALSRDAEDTNKNIGVLYGTEPKN